MSLSDAHKGYEYQDLFSAYHIINTLITDDNATFKIDQKETENDKFDDLTIITNNSIIKRQIKYSDYKIFEKVDLSSEKYDLALDTLFRSWQELPQNKNIDIRICLAWELLENSQDFDFLVAQDITNFYQSNDVKVLKINLEKIWPSDGIPISSWRRLRRKSSEINRSEFENFINDLTIEVNLPKSSTDFSNPGDLENLVTKSLRLFGVGKFPNNKKLTSDVAMHLMYIIKRLRATGEVIELNKVIYELGVKKSYGNIEQSFKIDRDINVQNLTKYHGFKEFVFINNKVALLGEPGSGKSWFIQNFIDFLDEQNIKVIQHYCYTGIDDLYEKDRITIDIFIANLINDIIKSFPYLESCKSSKYGVDFDELQLLINHIQEEVVLIVDGLDHIGRIYNFHRETMKQIDTKIVEVISLLVFPANVKVVLASQPVTEIINLCNHDFKRFSVKPWDICEVKEFITKNGLTDVELDYHYMLSDLLIKKSLGNPLYLTYLVNELSKYSHVMITRELIEGFPSYDNNLENYYSFLMTKLFESQRVPQILAGSPFPLTESDLKEITYLGAYVSESLEIIRSILSYNSCSGGYIIYHESFRRYVLELLEKNKVSVDKAIYSFLIDWLKKRGFYEDRKSYLNLFVLLFESKRYDEILEYCNKEFVVDSIFYGNNINSLKSNFEILMKTSCKVKDYGSVIICTELSNMIYSLEYSFDENSQFYYFGLGLINGFEKLKNVLVYEGKNALSCTEGLKVCYLCSENNVIPEWDEYIKLLIESKKSNKVERKSHEEQLEEYKYFVCACLDTGRNMVDKIEKVAVEDAYDYREVIITEYSRRGLIEELKELVNHLQEKEHWVKSIDVFLGEYVIDERYIDAALEKLLHSDSHSDDTLFALDYYFTNIEWIIINHSDKLNKFVQFVENRNWYYNWLIYVYEVNKVIIEGRETESIDESRLIEAYSWLTKDTECFKGEPRTCDLYNYKTIIFESLVSPLEFVSNEFTWRKILGLIAKMSSETMTTLSGSTGGPLPTYKLFDLFLEIANDINCVVLTEIFEEKIGDEDKRRFYSYLADYSLKHSIILAKSGRLDTAKVEFRRGVEYLLSYSFRKDRTLSRLIDSVENIYKIDEETGIQNILRLKPLADAVVYHTDGRSTKTYQKEWFEVLARTDREIALTHLSYELLKSKNYWILEESLDTLLEIMNSEVDPIIENALFRTRPNHVSSSTFRSYLNNIQVLITNSQIELARLSMRELLNRYTNGIYQDDYEEIKALCEDLNVEFNSEIKLNHSLNRNYSRDGAKKISFDKHIKHSSFDVMSFEEILEYIMNFGIKESEIQGLFIYLQSIDVLNNDSKMFISNLIKHTYDIRTDDKNRERILRVVDALSLDSEIMAYIYVSMFLNHKDGWYHRLTESAYFIKAVEFNKEIAEEQFFEYFYNNFYSVDYNLAVGDKIINILTSIGYDGKLIIQYWESLFEIINFRLSGQYDYDSEQIVEMSKELSTKEKAMFLLLTRLKYGEANRYRWIISSLNKMLEHPKYRICFIKPFKHYIEKMNLFIDYSLIVLLWLIRKYFTKEELHENTLVNDLRSVYPTDNGTVNYLIRNITGLKSRRKYKEYVQSYDGRDENINYFIEILIESDNRLSLLKDRGVDIGNIAKNYFLEITDKDTRKNLHDIIFDKSYSVVVPNVYFYDIFNKYMSLEVEAFINGFVGSPFLNVIEEEMNEILIDDIEYIIANCNSIIPRPSDIAMPEEINNSINDVYCHEWISLAYYERWYNKRERHKNNYGENVDSTIIISGVGFTDEEDVVPLLQLKEEYRLYDENHTFGQISNLKKNPLLIASNLKIQEDIFLTFRPYDYFSIRGDILDVLGIKIIDNGEGIIGIDKTGKIMLKYSKWEVCFDDIDTGSYRVPYIIGSEVKVKRVMYDKICKLYGRKAKRFTMKLET
ncbi:ATP-binding protein [Staphylococcus hyicus]|uniref:ATP-binding protein n=1 Tax=Staphylococcus hyicus TaxID=1284 RepID=UPI00208E78A2|nr:ATP-binding protein [Staphylococcus hyicus]MCO4329435.1 ATP-binding protein [Staphylococcus hyicus]MCO4337331.1 ATP-binding protein [Staphylococcus hyicus]